MKIERVKFAEDSQCAHCDAFIRRGATAYGCEAGDACSKRCADALVAGVEDADSAAKAAELEAR